jgi:hypothetical protein
MVAMPIEIGQGKSKDDQIEQGKGKVKESNS